MKDWTALRSRQQARRAQANGMHGHAGAAFDMARYWHGTSYLETAPGTPEPRARARAFGRALHEIPKRIPGDSLFCGEQDWLMDSLPMLGAEAGCADYERAVNADRSRRSFCAGYDHTIPDYPELLRVGIGGLLGRVASSRRTNPGATVILDAMAGCLQAFSGFVMAYAEEASRLGMKDLHNVLAKIHVAPPASFREAIQLVWLVHVAMSSEGRRHNALGRIDQYLLPFYEADLRNGTLSRDEALNLLCHAWCMIEGMHEITNLCIGGLKPDGTDATNELSYLCLAATERVRSPSTNLSARFHDGSPERYHRACAEVILSGIGFPAIFNDHTTIPALERLGIPVEAARDYALVGCIEPMIAGRQQAWGDSRFNTPQCLLEALVDLPACGTDSEADLFSRFVTRLRARLVAHAARINAQIAAYDPAEHPDPFLSSLTADCIGRGQDINGGGAKFKRMHGIAGMGLGTLADSLAAIKKLVIEERTIDFATLREALASDFSGNEPLRLMLANRAPKYGNAEPYVDEIARDIVKAFARECLALHTCDGGRFVPCMAANIQNISAGKEIGATPDGRRAETPLSDAASPYYGRDMKGPTAFISSVATPDYTDIACSVVNMRLNPEFFRGAEGVTRFTAFSKAFVAKRIQELQFNVNDDAVLKAAMDHPQAHRNLVVRVSGFSAYFTSLDKEIQHDILRRRSHEVRP
jgi:formate C-acetyltransferase